MEKVLNRSCIIVDCFTMMLLSNSASNVALRDNALNFIRLGPFRGHFLLLLSSPRQYPAPVLSVRLSPLYRVERHRNRKLNHAYCKPVAKNPRRPRKSLWKVRGAGEGARTLGVEVATAAA